MNKNVVLYDSRFAWQSLLPLTYTRPVSELKIGIRTIRQKWEFFLDTKISYSTNDYLSAKFSLDITSDNLVINSQLLPSADMLTIVNGLEMGKVIYNGSDFIAARLTAEQLVELDRGSEMEDLGLKEERIDLNCLAIRRPFDIFKYNGQEIINDFNDLTKDKISAKLNDTNTVIGDFPVFIASDVSVNCTIFNTTEGPIYLDRGATILEGSMIRGPFAMGEHAVVKMGAKIYKDTSIGDYCKVGGELNNVVMFSYSNKGHEGYLGNAVIGEWCNLGADTNNSNLKNNYSEVKLWSYVKNGFEKSGLQFCGLIMGDHSKTGINTMFNTGTVVGVAGNIFGAGYQKNFIPSFSWGEPKRLITYRFEKVIEVAEIVMKRRGVDIDGVDIQLLRDVFDLTASYRK